MPEDTELRSRVMQQRVAEFRRFLETTPARVVVCIGHSTFFRELTTPRGRLKNCELHTMYL